MGMDETGFRQDGLPGWRWVARSDHRRGSLRRPHRGARRGVDRVHRGPADPAFGRMATFLTTMDAALRSFEDLTELIGIHTPSVAVPRILSARGDTL